MLLNMKDGELRVYKENYYLEVIFYGGDLVAPLNPPCGDISFSFGVTDRAFLHQALLSFYSGGISAVEYMWEVGNVSSIGYRWEVRPIPVLRVAGDEDMLRFSLTFCSFKKPVSISCFSPGIDLTYEMYAI